MNKSLSKVLLTVLLCAIIGLGNGCVSAGRVVGIGRGSFSKDKFTLREKNGNDGRVTMYYNGAVVGAFDTPRDLDVPRSEGGVYEYVVEKPGFQTLRLRMVMKTHLGAGTGTAANLGFFIVPPAVLIGVLTDTVFTDSTQSMGAEENLEEDGDTFYYTLVPLGVNTGQQVGNNPGNNQGSTQVNYSNVNTGYPPPQNPQVTYVQQPTQIFTNTVDRVVTVPGETRIVYVTNVVERTLPSPVAVPGNIRTAPYTPPPVNIQDGKDEVYGNPGPLK